MAQAWIAKGYGVSLICRILGIPRSTYYYQTSYRVEQKQAGGGRPIPGYSLKHNNTKVSDEQIKEWLLEEIEDEGFTYGYRKLAVLLRRHYGLAINKKKVYRLCKELGLLRPQRQPKPTKSENEPATAPFPVPINCGRPMLRYGYIHGQDRFFFVLSYIDVYGRTVTGFHIGLHRRWPCSAASDDEATGFRSQRSRDSQRQWAAV